MIDQDRQRARKVFIEIADVAEHDRPAALSRLCGNDAALRAEVEALLAAEARGGDAISHAVTIARGAGGAGGAAATLVATPRAQSGQMIGRYKLLEQIGEGGFGTVWAAEQREPVKRRVALKIIKLGMDTRQVIARFEAERQALAMMDHANIARVLDAGATETGRPYFVMELVKGVPILEYCDREKLDTRARLDLFMKVCNAIQHAHMKGIIHRDIKPSNVLVTLHDGVPVPKVIDFGIAKATNQELTERTLYTEHRQMIGTPAYMSPEQAEMSGLDIDTRADIYSLGVLLYELLTGTTPFATDELMSKGFAEMMRIIREDEPHKPSTRLSSLGETGTLTAMQRHTDVKNLNLALRGDLDWIVMKCLEKDRTRRYETTSELAADIQRHLTDQPVIAGPPNAAYKLRKFFKRNRGRVIAGGAIAAMLVLGVIGTSLGMAWALNERSRADAEADRATLAADAEHDAKIAAEENAQKAIENAARAEREMTRATVIKNLITDMLKRVDPAKAKGADITLLKGILDDAAGRLSKGEVADEQVGAELHAIIGGVYQNLGLYPQAEQHLQAAVDLRAKLLGEDDPSTLISMSSLASLYRRQGRYADAEPLDLKTLEIRTRVLGAQHPQTLATKDNLAIGYYVQGRYAEAEPMLLENLANWRKALGGEHPDTLTCMNAVAALYWSQGRHTESEPLLTKTLEIKRKVLGPEHPSTLSSLGNLGILFAAMEKYDEAQALNLEALEIGRRVLGEEHPTTLGTIATLGSIAAMMKKYDEAAKLYESCLPVLRRVLGAPHPKTCASMRGLADAYLHLDRSAEAEPLLKELLEHLQPQIDSEKPQASVLNDAAWALTRDIESVRDPARAIEHARKACSIEEAAGGGMLWEYLDTLALAQHQTGDTAEAIATQRRVVELKPDKNDLRESLAKYETAMSGSSATEPPTTVPANSPPPR